MKPLRILLLLILTLPPRPARAQAVLQADSNHAKQRVRCYFYPRHDEDNLIWYKRMWRTIDLDQPINKPLGNVGSPCEKHAALFDVLKTGLTSETAPLTAFSIMPGAEEFDVPLTPSELSDQLRECVHDSSCEEAGTCHWEDVKAAGIKFYRLEEDWFFDKQRSILDARIIGICPLKQVLQADGQVEGYKPLFWIYYPEAEPALEQEAVCTASPTLSSRTFSEVFRKRLFSSRMDKESNVYERAVYMKPRLLNALLEAERVKAHLAGKEALLWAFEKS